MKVGDKIRAERANWDFSGDVPKAFDEHIRKSVPLYHEGHDLIVRLSDYFCLGDSKCYEIGSATGQLLKKLATHNAHKPGISWIGIEQEPEMVALAEESCVGLANTKIINQSVLNTEFEPADFIVSHLTIQFIPERDRQKLFDKIYQALNWGGAFVLFEKVRAPDARFQDIMTSLYQDYKKDQGFSADEIFNKEQSLKSAMSPFSTQGNIDLMKRAGFTDIMSVFKYIAFEGFLAIK